MDRSLRDADRSAPKANVANPGTTADLTAAAIFVVLLQDGLHGSGTGGDDAGSR
jgi:triphosphoribosyl-dephospho-CoA synthetase